MQSNKNKRKLIFLQKMSTYDGISKKCHVVFKIFFAFLKVSKLLYVSSFKSIAALYLKKVWYGGLQFYPLFPGSNC